jgi:hypothetical protein
VSVLLEAEIRKLPGGLYQVTVNGVVHTFEKLYDAFWTLKEAADQKVRQLRDQNR